VSDNRQMSVAMQRLVDCHSRGRLPQCIEQQLYQTFNIRAGFDSAALRNSPSGDANTHQACQ
jgi:hypothetical protein